jgi:asparagine synthase (glutamine-hydrolysing)
MASRVHRDLTIFHANVVGKTSECEAAQALAKHLGVNLRVIDVEDRDFIEGLPEVMRHYEQPFTFHPESIPYQIVCRLVQEHGHKAVLSGEGADELFLGYAASVPTLRKLLWRTYYSGPFAAGGFRLLRRSRSPGVRRGFALSDADRGLVRGLHNRFERDQDVDGIRAACIEQVGKAAYERQWSTLHQLAYGLRTLLHRNDTLGMASSVEARFPYLDSRLVKLVVNLPYRCKVRPVPAICDRLHPFVRDKWILRKVAGRYLPRSLSRRTKRPFPTNAFQRMQIDSQVFAHSFIAELFGLTAANLRYLTEHAGRGLKMRLLHLDVWGQVCLHNTPSDVVANRLHARLRVAA